MSHEFRTRISISCSPRWNGTANVPSWTCEFCADSYDTADELRRHIHANHPSIEITAEYGPDDPRYQADLAYVEALKPRFLAGEFTP